MEPVPGRVERRVARAPRRLAPNSGSQTSGRPAVREVSLASLIRSRNTRIETGGTIRISREDAATERPERQPSETTGRQLSETTERRVSEAAGRQISQTSSRTRRHSSQDSRYEGPVSRRGEYQNQTSQRDAAEDTGVSRWNFPKRFRLWCVLALHSTSTILYFVAIVSSSWSSAQRHGQDWMHSGIWQRCQTVQHRQHCAQLFAASNISGLSVMSQAATMMTLFMSLVTAVSNVAAIRIQRHLHARWTLITLNCFILTTALCILSCVTFTMGDRSDLRDLTPDDIEYTVQYPFWMATLSGVIHTFNTGIVLLQNKSTRLLMMSTRAGRPF